MKYFLSLFALFVVAPCTVASAAETKPALGRLLMLGVAYDEAPAQGHTSDDFNYAPDNFTTLFAAQSQELFSDIKTVSLKGKAVTRQALGLQLLGLQRLAKKNDLVFVYWGTHGGTDSKGWSANLADESTMYGSDIKAELAKLPCPVIMMVSTCGSGGFVMSRTQQVELPPNMAAFCACRSKQSTSNELDVSILEALSGFGDLDKNGQVTLAEVIEYVPLRYRKLMRGAEGEDVRPVLGQAPGLALDRPLTKVTGTHAAVVREGFWYGATILEKRTDDARVRFLGYDSTPKFKGPYSIADETLKFEAIDLPGGHPPLEVEQGGTWYPATIVAPQGNQFKIHYVGYPESDDEVVPLKRIRYPFVLAEGEALGPAGAGRRKKESERREVQPHVLKSRARREPRRAQ